MFTLKDKIPDHTLIMIIIVVPIIIRQGCSLKVLPVELICIQLWARELRLA